MTTRTTSLLLGFAALACASTQMTHSAVTPKLPLDVLTRARSELTKLGYTITYAPAADSVETGRLPIGGVVHGERVLGRDLDTGGILVAVITVSARPEAGQTLLEVNAGMEVESRMGMRQRTQSTKAIRNQAAELLERLK